MDTWVSGYIRGSRAQGKSDLVSWCSVVNDQGLRDDRAFSEAAKGDIWPGRGISPAAVWFCILIWKEPS